MRCKASKETVIDRVKEEKGKVREREKHTVKERTGRNQRLTSSRFLPECVFALSVI